MSGSPIRLFPGDDGDPFRRGNPDALAAEITTLAGRYAKLMGSSCTAALLAGMAHKHHLRSVPKGVRR